jgi:hypothetical protein
LIAEQLSPRHLTPRRRRLASPDAADDEASIMSQPDPNAGLARQALKRPLSEAEARLAAGLEQIFRSGVTDLERVVAQLQQNGIQLPSGTNGPWTVALLEQELQTINASLDLAYADGARS